MFGRRKKEAIPTPKAEISPAWKFILEVMVDLVRNQPWRTWKDTKAITKEIVEQKLAEFNEIHRLEVPLSLADLAAAFEDGSWVHQHIADQEKLLMLARTLGIIDSFGPPYHFEVEEVRPGLKKVRVTR